RSPEQRSQRYTSPFRRVPATRLFCVPPRHLRPRPTSKMSHVRHSTGSGRSGNEGRVGPPGLADFRFGNGCVSRFPSADVMNPADVNLYLVGFMGTGKTTVGRAVAQKIGFRVLDSDHEIERQQQKTIPDIFAQEGEPAFR